MAKRAAGQGQDADKLRLSCKKSPKVAVRRVDSRVSHVDAKSQLKQKGKAEKR